MKWSHVRRLPLVGAGVGAVRPPPSAAGPWFSEFSARVRRTGPARKTPPAIGAPGMILITYEVRQLARNSLKMIREQLLMSKAELARKAGVSPLTIDRIENSKSFRMETMRKIILALGYTLDDKDKIFAESQ
jgi:DNA-binding XRE family transcriptional regulator